MSICKKCRSKAFIDGKKHIPKENEGVLFGEECDICGYIGGDEE
jgi:hypothetical protein